MCADSDNVRYEVRQAALTILSDPKVLDAIKALNLPDDVVVTCDPWMYGADRDSKTRAMGSRAREKVARENLLSATGPQLRAIIDRSLAGTDPRNGGARPWP